MMLPRVILVSSLKTNRKWETLHFTFQFSFKIINQCILVFRISCLKLSREKPWFFTLVGQLFRFWYPWWNDNPFANSIIFSSVSFFLACLFSHFFFFLASRYLTITFNIAVLCLSQIRDRSFKVRCRFQLFSIKYCEEYF